MKTRESCVQGSVVQFGAKPLECSDWSPLLVAGRRGRKASRLLDRKGGSTSRSARLCRSDKSLRREKRRQVAALQSLGGASSGVSIRPLVLIALMICGFASFPVQADDGEEARLMAVLQSAATPTEKEDACRRLKLIGSAKSVPALASLLPDEHLYQAACDALETMPAPESGAALRAALKTTSGKPKASVIHALGERREPGALPELASLLRDPDPLLAEYSASALGRIGGADVVAALRQALSQTTDPVRSAIVDGLLRCAVQLMAQGDSTGAVSIFVQFNQPMEKDQVRTAAYAGQIRAAGNGALRLVTSALRGSDPATQLAALSAAPELEDPDTTRALTNLLTEAPPALQAALIALLQQRGDPAAASAVAAAAGSGEADVRATALTALGTLGDATAIPLLVKAVTSGKEGEQKAARQALIELRRGNVAEALVLELVAADDKTQVELIRALTARAENSVAPRLLEIARTGTGGSRRAALRAKERFAVGSDLAVLVELLKLAKDEPARAEVRNVFEALADRLGEDRQLDVSPIVAGLAGADAATRIELLQISAFFSDAGLRTAFRAALRDAAARVRNAAARALCRTRDGGLMPDLLELARNTGEVNLRALALEGYVRLAGDGERARAPAGERAAVLKPAMALATRAEEKRLVLAGLAGVPHPDALALAEAACADTTVQAEAEIACLKIAKALLASEPDLATASLNRLAAGANNSAVRNDAQALMKRAETGWLCSGPYRQDGKSGRELFDVAFAPEQPGSDAVKWRGTPGLADLSSVTAGDNCVVYLKTRVFLPAAQRVRLEIGSDDGIKLWVNREVIHANNTDRGVVPGQDKVQAAFRQGWNDLLAKITQNGGGCGMSLRIANTDGTEIPGLRVDPHGESRP